MHILERWQSPQYVCIYIYIYIYKYLGKMAVSADSRRGSAETAKKITKLLARKIKIIPDFEGEGLECTCLSINAVCLFKSTAFLSNKKAF